MADRLLGVLRHQLLQVGLGALVLLVGRAGPAVGGGKLRPGVGGAHIDDPDGLQPRSWRLDAEQPGRLAVLDAAPELLLCGQKKVLVQRVGMDLVISTHFPPPVMIDSTADRALATHILCCSWAICFSAARLLRERPGQHELGLEHRAAGVDQAVQRRRHPFMDGMQDPPLHVLDGVAGIALVPAPVEVLGDGAELDDQVVGQIFRLDLPSLLAPEPNEVASSLPMITRASEPPMKERRSQLPDSVPPPYF